MAVGIPYLDIFLLKGSADGVCAGVCVAGADVDFFSGAGIGAVMIDAVGYVTGNAIVCVACLTGLFIGIGVHHSKIPFR